MRVQPGAPNPDQDSINVTGEDVFGPMTTVQDSATGEIYTVSTAFSQLLAIKEQLATGKPDLDELSNKGWPTSTKSLSGCCSPRPRSAPAWLPTR
jgi:flagellar hook-associated protein 3 FlgL